MSAARDGKAGSAGQKGHHLVVVDAANCLYRAFFALPPLRTAAGFICLPLEPGPHRIVLQARLSPLRKTLLVLDGLLLALAAAALWWTRNKRQRPA